MCKTAYLIAFALLLAGRFSPATAEDLKCSNSHKSTDGSSSGSELVLSIAKEKITKLVFSTFNASGEEGGGYSCNFDSSEKKATAKWSVDGESETTLTLTDKSFGEESILNISKSAAGYVVEFEKVWSGYCGFGAEFPKRVTLQSGKANCIVVK